MKKFYIHKEGLFPVGQPGEPYVFCLDGRTWSRLYQSGKIEAGVNDLFVSFVSSVFKQVIKDKIWVEISEKFANELLGLSKQKSDEKSPLLFRHIRRHHDTGEIAGNGGCTVGVVINHTQKIIEIYPAICADTDTFDKQIGREIAEMRFNSQDGFKLPYDPAHSIIDNIFSHNIKIGSSDLIKSYLHTSTLGTWLLDIANKCVNYRSEYGWDIQHK